MECVEEILDFHVWALNSDQSCFTAKLTTRHEHADTLARVKWIVEEDYELFHSTIQIEVLKPSNEKV